MRKWIVFAAVFVLPGVMLMDSAATPQFAREYSFDCAKCHVHVPKLNEFGEAFLANGYALSDRSEKRKTVPASVWASGLSQNFADEADRFKTIPNRIEIISAGRVDDRFSYFVEWRVLSREFLGDMSVRDRSGRFEDLFVLMDVAPNAQVQVGQFRALSQIDVSRRLHLAEPLAFSTSLPGEADPDARIQSLRGFSPSGRAPSLRVLATHSGWTGAVTIPFPGEFSIPLTREAQDTASMEFEGNPKGIFLEAYRRNGVNSYGVHGFLGNNERRLIGVAAQHRYRDFWFEGGVNHAKFPSNDEWRYSLGVEWIPQPDFAAGLRVDHRQISGQVPTFLPFVSFLRPFGEHAAKLVIEGRLQENRTPRWIIELGWMF